MITGDSISGDEAARRGWGNRSFPEAELEAEPPRNDSSATRGWP